MTRPRSGFSSESIRSVMAEDMCRGGIAEGSKHVQRAPSLDQLDKRSA